MKVQSPTVEVRRANERDLPYVVAVLAESFAEYRSLYTDEGYAATTPDVEAMRKRFDEGSMWVATFAGKIVGTVSVVPKNQSLYIRGMAALPDVRGTGIGARLLNEVELYAVANGYNRLFLSTTPFLSSAIRLYEKFGFERNGDPPHELHGTPLVTMSKNLT